MLIQEIFNASFHIAGLQAQGAEFMKRASVPGLHPHTKATLEARATQAQQMVSLFDTLRKAMRDGINMSTAWLAGNREIGRNLA